MKPLVSNVIQPANDAIPISPTNVSAVLLAALSMEPPVLHAL